MDFFDDRHGLAGKAKEDVGMKLRIQGNSLRFRLAPGEPEALLRHGALFERVDIGPPPSHPFRYAVVVYHDEKPALQHRGNELRFSIPVAWADALASGKQPEFETLIEQVPGHAVRVQLECDLPCAHKPEKRAVDTALGGVP